MYVYLNGDFVDEKHASISVFDRGFLYGDGVFETMRAYESRIAWIEQHLERLFQSANTINLNLQQSKRQFKKHLQELIGRNTLGDALIRVTVTRGVGPSGLDPGTDQKHTTVIAARPYRPYPPTHYSKGVSVVVVTIKRNSIESMPPSMKSLNFLNNILAKAEATQKGAFDGIMLNQHDHITEATTSNLFVVMEGTLVTPAVTCGILEGITRNVVLELAEANNLPIHQQPLTMATLYAAEECFLTNTSMEIMPVTKIDEHVIGSGRPGPTTIALHAAFRHRVEQHLMDY